MYKRLKVRDYQVMLGDDRRIQIPDYGPPAQRKTIRYYARILLTSQPDANEPALWFLNLYFLRSDSEQIQNYVEIDRKVGAAFLPVMHYAWYLDLLRNEGPVYMVLNSDEPHENGLDTNRIPAG